MSHAQRKRAEAREELGRAEAALRRASLLLEAGGAIYEGAVAEHKAREVSCLAGRLTPKGPDPAPAQLALVA